MINALAGNLSQVPTRKIPMTRSLIFLLGKTRIKYSGFAGTAEGENETGAWKL